MAGALCAVALAYASTVYWYCERVQAAYRLPFEVHVLYLQSRLYTLRPRSPCTAVRLFKRTDFTAVTRVSCPAARERVKRVRVDPNACD